MSTVPFEIIHKIFAYHATTLSIYSHGVPNTFPWFLGHVCTSWRTVFLSMYAEFWSSFVMLPNAPLSTADRKRSLDIVTSFMERTNGRPISLSLHLDHMSCAVIEILVQHSKQWQHVELTFDQKQLSLLSSIKNQLPLLCSLRLKFSRPPLLIGPQTPIALFENALRLTHVQINNPLTWRFRWPSLSTLILPGLVDVDRFLETLTQLENLETLHIMQRDRLGTIADPSTSIKMTRLKVLRTHGSMILAFLTAPSLEILHIGMCSDWYFTRVFSTFFRRSACRLLGISLASCDSQSLSAILPFVPNIETLFVRCIFHFHNNSLGDFFNALACPPGEPFQLPHLHTIRLSMSFPITEEDVTALRLMIALRTLGPRPKMREILLLPLQGYCKGEDRVLWKLEELGQEYEIQGIQIEIKPTSYPDLSRLYGYFEIPFTTRLYR